jgi:hypothetical protein
MKTEVLKLADEIEKDWFGPNGKYWCKEKQMYIKPETCTNCCPECQPLGPQVTRQFRYVPQNDYKRT